MSLGNAIRAPQDSLRPGDNFILLLNAACRFPSKNGGGKKKIRGKNTFHNKSTAELRHNGSVVEMFALMAQRGGDLNLPNSHLFHGNAQTVKCYCLKLNFECQRSGTGIYVCTFLS